MGKHSIFFLETMAIASSRPEHWIEASIQIHTHTHTHTHTPQMHTEKHTHKHTHTHMRAVYIIWTCIIWMS